MTNESIKRMFERRPFTEDESAKMRELYADAEAFAHRINRTLPGCADKEHAISLLKVVLSACETAVALNPKPTTYAVDCCSESPFPKHEIKQPRC